MDPLHKNDWINKAPKTSTDPVPAFDPNELTCGEGQVEDLLSEGESTEADREEEKVSEKPARQNASSQKIPSNHSPGHRQKS